MVQKGQMILLKNKNGSTFYYDDELRILVPVRQTVYQYPIKGFKETNKILKYGLSQLTAQLIRVYDANKLFPKLAQIETFEAWKIYENNGFFKKAAFTLEKTEL